MKSNQLVSVLASNYLDKNFENKETYEKALNIRLCLEEIVNNLFVFLIDRDKSLEMIKKLSLGIKIDKLKEIFPSDIIEMMRKIKDLMNDGVHQGYRTSTTEGEIEMSRGELRHLTKWVFVGYFKKYGFTTEHWVPTLFSVLMPSIRIEILEEVIKFNKEFAIIDKLSMAYLKSNEYNKSINFLKKLYDDGIINCLQYSNQIEKINFMKSVFSEFSISKNINDSAKYFFQIVENIPENEKNPFITIMSMILEGYKTDDA